LSFKERPAAYVTYSAVKPFKFLNEILREMARWPRLPPPAFRYNTPLAAPEAGTRRERTFS
jgi:hypothetical protein